MMGWYIWYRTADAAWRKEAKIEMEKDTADDENDEGALEEGSEKSSVRSSHVSPDVRSGKR